MGKEVMHTHAGLAKDVGIPGFGVRSIEGATATTPERLSRGHRPQTPQQPQPRPESRVGIRNHEAGRSFGPDPQDTGSAERMFQ